MRSIMCGFKKWDNPKKSVYVNLMKISMVDVEERECSDKGAVIIYLGDDSHYVKVKESLEDVLAQKRQLDDYDDDKRTELIKWLRDIAHSMSE